jgi:diacylglycerol kinase family enzyme
MMKAPGREPVVVVNPAASGLADPKRRGRIVGAVVEAVTARTGRAPLVADTTAEAAREALGAALDAPLVVVVGGDGTVRAVADAIAGSGVPIAIVPAGTGNVCASALRIPRRTGAAIRLIGTGRPEAIDLGRASWGRVGDGAPGQRGLPGPADGSHLFVVACGVGLDARIMAGASAGLKRRIGFGAYLFSTIREAVRLRPATFRIDADGVVHELRGLVVLVANCGQLVPGLVGPRRTIDPTDGRFDVVVVRAASLPGAVFGSAELMLSGDDPPHRSRRAMRIQAARVTVTAEPSEPVEVDGDHHDADWLAAEVMPGAMTVVRP